MSDLDLVRLPNGVRVALDPMPGLATTALGVWQRVGARWEPAEINGIAHLFEHMARARVMHANSRKRRKMSAR
jgi:predicted Zn-dependent peptidase